MSHTPIVEPTVSRSALAVASDGREFSLAARVGRPYRNGDDWACAVDLVPLHPRLPDVHGVDSWQALQLCYRLIAQLLTAFEKDGGRLYWPDEREPMNASDFYPGTGS